MTSRSQQPDPASEWLDGSCLVTGSTRLIAGATRRRLRRWPFVVGGIGLGLVGLWAVL